MIPRHLQTHEQNKMTQTAIRNKYTTWPMTFFLFFYISWQCENKRQTFVSVFQPGHNFCLMSYGTLFVVAAISRAHAGTICCTFIWNNSVASCEGRPQTHKRLKECFLIGRKRTKRANFRGSPLFQATYNVKTNNYFSLSCVHWMWEAGVSLVPFSFRQPPTSSWHKISWTNCLFFFFYIVCSLKKRTSSKICTFCLVSSN